MSTVVAEKAPIEMFRNEPYTDFSTPEGRRKAEEAAAKVKAELGREYDLRVAGRHEKTHDTLRSVNPSRPSETVGIHHKATVELANEAIESAAHFFPEWSATPARQRIDMLMRAAALIRKRKYEFDAWLVYEAGKTWPEAEGDVSEAIDFCEYYALQMQKLANPDAVVQLPGEHDEMVYLALGVGVIIPPWNFPLAILAGMTAAALVTGNTVVIKPSSDTPTIAAKFAEVLVEAGFPEKRFSGGASQDSLCLVHRLARRRAAHQRTCRQTAQGTEMDQARGCGDGRQG